MVRAQERPGSLRFAPGYEPDFARGVVEVSRSHSRFYGGAIRKFRILSRNRRIQYQFVAAPRHAWIIPPQALTTDITPFGVRSIDVHAAEELCVPGYEYCYVDESTRPPTLHSQIPPGFAGAPSELDPARLDASAWIERLPVIREFRRKVLRRARADWIRIQFGPGPVSLLSGFCPDEVRRSVAPVLASIWANRCEMDFSDRRTSRSRTGARGRRAACVPVRMMGSGIASPHCSHLPASIEAVQYTQLRW